MSKVKPFFARLLLMLKKVFFGRFVNTFSTQPMIFGKVQKQIKCEIMKPTLSNPDFVKPQVHRTEKSLPVVNPTAAVNLTPVTVTETQFDPYVEDAAFDNFNNGDDDLVSETDANVGQVDIVVQEKHEPEADSESSKKQKKVGEKGKKKTTAKKKVENTPKLNIPGSAANRLMFFILCNIYSSLVPCKICGLWLTLC